MSSLPVVRQSTGLALNDGPTVLGERQVRIPTAGKIRPGIKVLTKTAAKNKEAVAIYQRGVAAGKSYGLIESEIVKACEIKVPLVPKNVPYFTARRADFAVPEVADRVMQLYGEDKGEGRQIYRLPIIFPVDYWQAVLPHALKAYTRSELQYWSDYGPDGKRYCKTHKPLEVDKKSQRAPRPWGGRPVKLRDENDGLCVPEKCKEYQEGACKLSGSLIFYIKGVPGASAIELPMTSFYSMQGIRQQLELILHTHGRLTGIVFYLAKRHEEVSMLDLESGKPKRVGQWITVLEADVDMTKLLTRSEVQTAGAEAVAALEGPGRVIDAEPEEQPGEEAAAAQAEANPSMSVEEMQKIVTEKVPALGLKFRDEFTPYAVDTWGADWTTNPEALSRIIDELTSVEDPDAYRKKVRTFDIPF
jgi:hypothetical protein